MNTNTKEKNPGGTCQAKRVIDAFGGQKALLIALWKIGVTKDRIALWRWSQSREKGGGGGYIPATMWDAILMAADVSGIELTDELLSPRVK